MKYVTEQDLKRVDSKAMARAIARDRGIVLTHTNLDLMKEEILKKQPKESKADREAREAAEQAALDAAEAAEIARLSAAEQAELDELERLSAKDAGEGEE